MRFIVKDTNLFFLPGNKHMLHIATIGYSLREFVAMLDVNTQKIYIEEVVLVSQDFSKDVYANFKFIDEDELAQELSEFCDSRKLLDMKRIQDRLCSQSPLLTKR